MKRVDITLTNPKTHSFQSISVAEPVEDSVAIHNALAKLGLIYGSIDDKHINLINIDGISEVRCINGVITNSATIVTILEYDC